MAKAAAAAGAVAPPWWKRLRAEPDLKVRAAITAASVFIAFLFWHFETSGSPPSVSPNLLSSPSDTFGSDSWKQLSDRELMTSIIDTLQRIFVGVGLAALVGITLGVAAGANRGIAAAFEPYIIFLRSVPLIGLVALSVVAFKTGETQKTMFLFFAIVPFVFSDTVKAILLVPERYVETAQTLGAKRLQIVLKVLVPLALPDIITSLRFQFGLALGYITLAESLDANTGLGVLIYGSQREGKVENLYLLLFIVAAIALVIDLVLVSMQRGVFRWRKDL